MEFDIEVALMQEQDNPADFINLYNIGLYYFNIGNMNDSIKYLERSATIADSQKGYILFQLAMSYENIDLEKGKKILDEALKISPELEGNIYMGSRSYYGARK